jgi:type I restriction enzyme S subunit
MKTTWQTVPMGELCSISSGDSDTQDAVENGPYAFFDRSRTIKRSSRYLYDCEALIIPGEGKEFLPKHFAGKFDLHQRAYALFDFSDRIEVKFLYYFLHHVSDYFPRVAVGATVKSLRRRHFEQLPVSLTSPTEQRRIVSILDRAFEGIATAKANAEKNLQNARALFESHLESIFTQRRNGWVETTLGEVCEFVGGSQPPKSVFSRTKKADNVRLIQIRDYKSDNHIVYIPRAQARRFCKADDVMIGRYGPPLFQILRGLDGAYNVALMKAVPDESRLSRDFLFYFLKHSSILQYVIYHSERAAGQIGLTKETLEPYPIALPSLAEQRTVVGTIRELEAETERLSSLYERKLAALEELRASLLHQGFTGQL